MYFRRIFVGTYVPLLYIVYHAAISSHSRVWPRAASRGYRPYATCGHAVDQNPARCHRDLDRRTYSHHKLCRGAINNTHNYLARLFTVTVERRCGYHRALTQLPPPSTSNIVIYNNFRTFVFCKNCTPLWCGKDITIL